MRELAPRSSYYVPVKITFDCRVRIGHVSFRLTDRDEKTIQLETLETPVRFETYTHAEFFRMTEEEGKAIVDEHYFSQVQSKLRVESGIKPFHMYKPHQRLKAYYYRNMIQKYVALAKKLDGLPRTADDLGPYMARLSLAAQGFAPEDLTGLGRVVRTFEPISVGQFNRLYRAYVDSGENMLTLVSKNAGPKGRVYPVCAESLPIWRKHAQNYASPRKPSQRDVFHEMEAEIGTLNIERAKTEPPSPLLAPCSFKIFRRLINEMTAYHICRERHGRKRAQREFALSSGGFSMFRPGERVDIDEKVIDLMILLQYAHIWDVLSDDDKNLVLRLKVWVVVAIDVATRYILAMRFCHAPNSEATIDVIRMSMSDKTELSRYLGAISLWIGRMRAEMIYTDNGSALVAEAVEDVLVQSGIGHMRPPAEQPAARGHLESFFRGNARVVRFYSGRTFKDVLDKGDYDAVANASVTIDKLARAFVPAILDVYHNTPHDGLGGETPANCLIRLTQQQEMRPLLPPDIMRNIFGMKIVRTLGGHGLTFFGIDYQSPELARMFIDHGAIDLTMSIDLMNLRSASVEVPAGMMDNNEDGWLIADNDIHLADSISLAEWMAMWRYARQQFADSTEITIDIAHQRINEQRLSGEAAALRNPIALHKESLETILKEEKSLLHGVRLARSNAPLGGQRTVLDAPVINHNGLFSETIPGFEDLFDGIETQQVDLPKTPARRSKSRTKSANHSKLGNAGDITF